MIKDSKEKIFDRLIAIANNFESDKENYFISYPYFLEYFRKFDKITPENLIIGISFTYSWMPTILKFSPKKNTETAELFNRAVDILNKVKNEANDKNRLTKKELLTLKELFNNSLVGTSKLLHFINPGKYAIWDSKVFRFLYDEQPHKYKLERAESYLEYLDFIDSLIADKNFEKFYLLMKQKTDFQITKYRALELVFFKGI